MARSGGNRLFEATGEEGNRPKASGRCVRSGRSYWTISRRRGTGVEMLTLWSGESLPVFSFEEEAELFLNLRGPAGEWERHPTTPGELASILLGSCSGVASVVLDPITDSRPVDRLLSVPRNRFVESLLRS